MENINTTTATNTNATIIAELERLATLSRTEFVGRLVSLDINTNSVLVDDQHPDIDGVSIDIYNGLTRRVGLPNSITPSAAAEFVAEHAAAISRVQRGLSREFDGSNNIGRLTADAAAAVRALESAAESMIQNAHALWGRGDIIDEMDASEYLDAIRREIEGAETLEAAIALALETLAKDGVADYGDGLVYIDRDEAADYARGLWEEANEDDDE